MKMDSYVTWMSLDGFELSSDQPSLETNGLPTAWERVIELFPYYSQFDYYYSGLLT